MKVNELRLGNLVSFNHKWDIISKVEEIQQRSVRVSFETQPNLMNGLTTHPDNYIAIRLTEEWIINFGFEKTKHSHGYDCYIKDGFDFDIVSHGRYWVLAIYTDESCTDSLYFAHGRLEYVHQLQNLYFALTGEELTIQTKSKLRKMFGKQIICCTFAYRELDQMSG